MKTIKYLTLTNGKAPFEDWLFSLTKSLKITVIEYLDRVSRGGVKRNIKSLGDGVFEIKIRHGGGLRIYFGEKGKDVIILLSGGNKGSQDRDIKKAKEYWKDYNA